MKCLYFSALGLKYLLVVRQPTLILSPASFQDIQCVFIKHRSVVSDLMPFFFILKKKAREAFNFFAKYQIKQNY